MCRWKGCGDVPGRRWHPLPDLLGLVGENVRNALYCQWVSLIYLIFTLWHLLLNWLWSSRSQSFYTLPLLSSLGLDLVNPARAFLSAFHKRLRISFDPGATIRTQWLINRFPDPMIQCTDVLYDHPVTAWAFIRSCPPGEGSRCRSRHRI